MSSKTFVRLIAVSMVVVSLINAIMLTLISPSRFLIRIIRFILTCIIAVLFIRGYNWIRWLTGIGAILNFILMIVAFFSLPEKFSIFGIWTLLIIAYEAFIAYAVLIDRRIQDHFNPSSGF